MDQHLSTVPSSSDDPVVQAEPPAAPRPKWPFVLAGILLVIGVAIAVLWPIRVPYYALSPGPVYDTSDFVTAEGGQKDGNGEMFFLTVSLKEANVFEYLAGLADERVDIAPREHFRPPGVTQEEQRREGLALMDQSKTDATFVALTELGYEPTLIGTGAVVIETVEGTGANGVLLPEDIIVAIDGELVEFRSDVIELLADLEIGDAVVVTIERIDAEGNIEELDQRIVLGPHVDDPTQPMIGILLDNNEPIVEFPVVVKIDSNNIGGPSAGMMFTLQIMDQLTEEDLTNGHRIAGTGTIGRDGIVGPIGGVRQKVFGAIEAGAHAILVPAGNFDEALEAGGDSIIVVKIETIDDAIDFLATL